MKNKPNDILIRKGKIKEKKKKNYLLTLRNFYWHYVTKVNGCDHRTHPEHKTKQKKVVRGFEPNSLFSWNPITQKKKKSMQKKIMNCSRLNYLKIWRWNIATNPIPHLCV